MKNYKISRLQFMLTTLFVVCLLVSNIIVGKQIELPYNIIITGGELLFPITYIMSDLFSEVYGYRWSRTTCYVAFACNVFMVSIFALVLMMPYPDYWTSQSAFETVLGNTPRVLLASSLAFVVGDFVNDRVFRLLKRKHPDSHDGFGFRAIVSSFFGQITDSLIFMPIAFIGVMPVEAIIQLIVIQVVIKTGYEFLILPLNKILVRKVSAYENATS